MKEFMDTWMLLIGGILAVAIPLAGFVALICAMVTGYVTGNLPLGITFTVLLFLAITGTWAAFEVFD